MYKLIVLMSFFLFGCRTVDSIEVLDAAEFQEAMSKPAVVVLDVRTPEEYEKAHLPGAKLVNWKDSTEFRTEVAKLDSTATILVYCKAGIRSNKAADWLRRQGFEQVRELKGGIDSWTEKKLPVEP